MKTNDIIMEAVRARIDHPEDWIWRNGYNGYQSAITALDYAQTHTDEIKLKYDGTPALIIGRDDDGQLVVTDKSGFGATTYDGHPKSAKALYLMLYGRKPTEQGRHEYAATIASLWNLFESVIPKTTRGFYQGDLLYAGTPSIEDDEFVFKPNKIEYRIPVNSQTGSKIANSKAGIVFHSFFKNKNQSVPDTIDDVKELTGDSRLFVISANMPSSNITKVSVPKFDFSGINDVLDKTILTLNKLTIFPSLVGKYINQMARDGNHIDKDSINGFFKWLSGNVTIEKEEQLKKFIEQNKKSYVDMWKAILVVTKFKDMIKEQLEQVAGSEIKATLNGVPNHEGYVVSTPSGKIKLVDRYTYMAKSKVDEQTKITEDKNVHNNVVVVYPGRFQPWHKGHAAVYSKLKNQFENVYIATSEKIELTNSPFSFDEKLQMITATGIPVEKVIKTSSPYRPTEILKQYDPKTTKFIIVVSKKDMTGKSPRFSFNPKKDGTPSYYIPFNGSIDDMKPMDQNGYVYIVPVYEFDINGTKISSATEIRNMFRKSNPNEQHSIIKDLYGKYIPEIHELFNKKINILNTDKSVISEAVIHHMTTKTPFRESILRPGSKSFFEMIDYIKENINILELDEIDREILETDIGEIVTLSNGTMIPLDLPIFEDELIEAEYKGKQVALNRPARGGSKKFYVYVRDPKTKNIKKISFGDTGLSVKANDPARVKSFVARHDCKNKKDKTKAGYWACRAPRYKSLGIKGGQWW